jgi:uncharacterized membrane protein
MSDPGREFSKAGVAVGYDQPAARSTAIAGKARASARHRAPHVILALALIGLGVAVYDSHAIYQGQLLWCPPPIGGCNEVAASPYARIFDLPVGYYGVVYYLYMAALAALLASDPWSRGLRIGAALYAALGVSFSLYFMVLQVGYIRAFCIYCLVSAVTTVLLTATAVSHWQATRRPVAGL